MFDKATFSWSEFLFLGAILIAAYFTLQLLKRFLQVTQFFGRFQRPIKNVVYNILLIFEPTVILLLSSAFLMLNPIYHAILLGLFFVFFFPHIRNYVHGRIVQSNNSLATGREIKIGNLEGIVNGIERLGLKIKTTKGLHFISYSHIIRDGYMLLSGDDISGYYQLLIVPNEPNSRTNYEEELIDYLSSIPYLDWTHKPEIVVEENYQIKARVIVKDESHLQELMNLISGRNYSCKILK
ncbi:MAG: hypothetical protein HC803_04025 [Saprospiraceae bacterium]|nr:hypothetical protein [Saprospiraceae bacterium]